MTKKVLVTGANGFIGSRLCQRLQYENFEFSKFHGDISSFQNVYDQISNIKPDVIYHLAGISNLNDCEKLPDKAFEVNVTGTFNILESLKKVDKQIRLIFPSTSHVYEQVKGHEPVQMSEHFPTLPQSVYGVTKLTSEKLIQLYFEKYDMGTGVVFRLFNHTAKSQVGPFFFPQMISQIEAASEGSNVIKVGNLKIYRDFGLVDDLIDLFVLGLKDNLDSKFKVYNACSSQPRYLEDVVNTLARKLGKNITLEVDPSKVRIEPPSVIGSNQLAQIELNWRPAILTTEQFVERLLVI
jgi:GDP-4-dehydro-6-deoxy-D-mannose reductase